MLQVVIGVLLGGCKGCRFQPIRLRTRRYHVSSVYRVDCFVDSVMSISISGSIGPASVDVSINGSSPAPSPAPEPSNNAGPTEVVVHSAPAPAPAPVTSGATPPGSREGSVMVGADTTSLLPRGPAVVASDNGNAAPPNGVPRANSITGAPPRRKSMLQTPGVLPATPSEPLPPADIKPRRKSIANLIHAVSGEPRAKKTKEEIQREVKESGSHKNEHFVCRSWQDVVFDLATDEKEGLTTDEAMARLAEVGKNELAKEPPVHWFRLFLAQFEDILVILLLIASIVSLALGEYAAAVVIILIVMANAILGVVQETRAEAALDELKSVSADKADVQRDGKRCEVAATELVPGDIVYLDMGCQIPADIRLIEAGGLFSLEAALTGEPEGIKKLADWVGTKKELTEAEEKKAKEENERKMKEKQELQAAKETKIAELKAKLKGDALEEALAQVEHDFAPKAGGDGEHKEKSLDEEKNMVFMGCQIVDGRGKGVVVKTGMATKMGEIQHMLNTADDKESPLEQKLDALGNRLGLASISISIIVLIVGLSTGRGIDHGNDSQPAWLQMVLVAVSLTVAAVPEGLPACVTITLAIGMAAMAKRNAIIRQLHSVETLGSASVICSDKTGTLTAGKMTAVRVWFGGKLFRISGVGYDPNGVVAPVETNPDDKEAMKRGADLVKAQPAPTLSLLLGLLCSNAQLQLMDKQLNAEELKQQAAAQQAGREYKVEKEWQAVGNATDRPVVVAAFKAGYRSDVVDPVFQRVRENPFNSARKMMSVIVTTKPEIKSNPSLAANIPFPELFNPAAFAIAKGAPNIILEHCVSIQEPGADGSAITRPLTAADRTNILKSIDELSAQAFRVLAVGLQPLSQIPGADFTPEQCESNLILTGLIASIDPERPGVRESINTAAKAGIRVVMITGDYLLTAKAIAENIDILPRGSTVDQAVDCARVREVGDEINDLMKALAKKDISKDEKASLKKKLDSANLRVDAITRTADVYARAKPSDKITIVRSLQRQGNVCSMTGDGVNDAPALKQADIGVAMGITGTAVAKSAAKIVLTDDNFISIVAAIEEGRTIYNNITKFVFYLLSTNVSEVFFILISVCLGLPAPLVPIQILWLNLVTDGAPAIALAVEPSEPGIMEQGPRLMSEPLLEKVMLTGVAIHTVVLTACCICTFLVGLSWHTTEFGGTKYVDGVPVDIGAWNGNNLELDSDAPGLQKARTMSILFIVFAELMRAYTSRSQRLSLFTQGVFSNKWMQPATGIAVIATCAMVNIPGLQDVVFKTRYIDGKSWGFVIGLSFVPAFFDEVVKCVYRATGFGERPKARRTGHAGGDHSVAISIDDKKDGNLASPSAANPKQPLVAGGDVELSVR